jgi:hypothetical protein
MTWLESTIKSLEGSTGKSANEIWKFIKDNNLVNTRAKDPLNNVIYPLLQRHTDNIDDGRSGKAHFTSFGSPRKFKLIDRKPIIKKFTDDFEKDNKEPTTNNPINKNPFGGYPKSDINSIGISAILVLGESGAGKSYTISEILENEGHKFQFIIPTAATTGLLAQYSSRERDYVPSRLSNMIIEAYKNPQSLYTAVFDECHKSNIIEMINDELLQAISKRRNRGDRFISLDDDTSEGVFKGENIKVNEQGNIIIPDNLGFIFISSNPRVIGGNPDFFNRVDLVQITEDNRNDFNSSDDLLEKSLKDRKDKESLIVSLKTKPNI